MLFILIVIFLTLKIKLISINNNIVSFTTCCVIEEKNIDNSLKFFKIISIKIISKEINFINLLLNVNIINSININEPRIEPCRTPAEIGLMIKKLSLTLVFF